MKKLWIVLFAFCSLIAKSQSITVNRVYNSLGNDNPFDLICGDGCMSLLNFRRNGANTPNQFFLRLATYRFLANGDTSFNNLFDPFSEINHTMIYFKRNTLIIRSLEITSLPLQNPTTFGRTLLKKFNLKTQSLDWERYINSPIPNGGFYNGSSPADGLFYPDSTRIYYLGTRELYPTAQTAAHPFIQEYDTSGILIGEADFLSPFNRPSEVTKTAALPNGNLFISALDRTNTQERYYARWIDGASFTSYKLKYLPNLFQSRSSFNLFKVIPIKPGDKYLVYLQGELFNSIQRDTVLYLTDSSLSLQNAYWIKRGKFYNNFTALDDGNIFAYYENVNSKRIETSKIDVQTGANIWAINVSPIVPPFLMEAKVKFNFDDSGNVYFSTATGIAMPLGKDIWLAKLSNVGQPWDPWRTSPNGTGEVRKKFTFYPYPNPTTGRLRLRGLKETEGVSLRLFNNQGQEVWKGSLSMEGEIDISNLPIGLYHLEALNAQGQRWSSRVVRD